MKLMRNEWLHIACWQLRKNIIVAVLTGFGLLGMALPKMAHAQGMSTTTVQGTLYLANGLAGSGTLQVSWPSFTTAGGQAVVAGSTILTVGSDGFVSVNLTPNVGASPAGLYYTAVFYLSNGTTTTQYWVVPAASEATLAQVQSQVMPAAQAVQAVSKAYVDEAVAEAEESQLSVSGETMTGPLILSADPTQALQAADKHYVDVSVSDSSTQAGTAGQIAYYTSTGTAIGGTNAVPVTAGGTGAGTAATGLQNLGGISATATTQQTMAGGLSIAGPLTASVNSQINVMAPPFNAKGDCVTDDSAAIQAALNVQKTALTQITVYFPAPPGGCYLTSTLTFTGASMQGQAGAGFVGTGGGVILKGKPSLDVLHIPDPNTAGSINPRTGWAIHDLVIEVDDSVDASASFPHRKPGRTVQDAAMTASSNVFTSVYAEITCGDTGQNILVKGAGAGGADLSTTIANVSPCWSNGTATVTLAASASTTVSNAYAYITPASIPVTQTIGNCGFAADNYDGNSADWVISGGIGTFQPQLWNVTFTSTTQNPTHNACAWYSSGSWTPYMMDAKNVWVWNQEWGIIQGMPDTNPSASPAIGQDFQKWDHGWLYATYPWISYNGGETTLEGIQLTAKAGPQILQVKATNEGAPSSWYIHVPEFELATIAGWRIEGYSATVVATELCDGQTGVIDTNGSRFINSNCGGSLALNGENNWLDGGGVPNPNITNKGMDNIYEGSNHQGSSGMWSTTVMAQTLNRGHQPFGTLTPDFIRNGTAPYYSDHDLFIWPQDFTDIYGYQFNVAADTNSWTGNYAAIPVGGYDLFYFNNMYMLGRPVFSCNTGGNCNQIYAGQNIPAGPVLVEFSYKCPSITSLTATIRAYGTGATVGGPAVLSCSTTYRTASILADFTSYASQAFDLNISTGEVDISWMAIKPYGAATLTNATIPGAPSGSYIKADGTGYGTPSSGVTQISAGTNVTISPSGGTGNVTINASATQTTSSGNHMGSGPSLTAPVFADGSLTDRQFFRLNGNYEWDSISGMPAFSFGMWHASSASEVQMVHALNYGFAVPTYTVQGILQFNSGGAASFIGVTKAATAAGSTPGGGGFYGIGFTPALGFAYYNGTALSSLLAASSLTSGNYYVLTMVSINNVGYASICPLGNTSGSSTYALSGGLPTTHNFVADSQSTSDVQFGLRYSSGYFTFNGQASAQIDVPASDITYNVPWPTMLTVPGNPSGTNNTYVILPPNYRPGGQYPWVIYVTGHGEPGSSILGSSGWPNQGSIVNYLANAGFVVVGMDYTSETNWGNQNATLDTQAIAKLWPQYFNLAPQPYVLAESMGGIVALNSIYYGKLKPRAMVALYPVYSLSSMYGGGSGTFASEIQTSYGFSGSSGYGAATVGYDPALDAVSTFSGIPMDIWCSSADTTVACSTNGQALASAVTAAGGVATFNASSGNHGDASNFDPVAVINFFNSH